MRVVDWMPIAVKYRKLKPPESLRLIRMMQPIAGSTEWRAIFKPRFDYGRLTPSLTSIRPGLLLAESPEGNVFLQYPEAETKAWDGIVTRISLSLHAESSGAGMASSRQDRQRTRR